MSMKKDLAYGLLALVLVAGAVGAFLLFSGPSVEDLLRQAEESMEAGNYQQALDLYSRAEDRQPANVAITIHLARVNRLLGRVDEAREHIQEALLQAPQDTQALIQAGLIEIDLGDYEEASELFTRVLNLQPTNANGLAGLGKCQYELGRARAADYTLTRGLLGETKAEILDQALLNLERSLQGGPSDPIAVMRYRCLCMLELGDPEGALPLAESLVRQSPEDGLNYHVLAMVHLEIGNLDEARQNIEKAFENVRQEADNPDKYRRLGIVMGGFGRVHYQLGHLNEAVEHFVKATRNDRLFVDAFLNTAAILALQGKHEEALAWLQEARGALSARGGRQGVAPNEPALILYRMANEAQRLRQIDRSLALLRKTTERAPDFAQGFYAVAAISLQAGDEAVARQTLKTVLDKDPGHLNAAYDLGALLMRDGLVSQAADQFQKVLELTPESADVRLSLAEAYRRMGSMDQANEQYELARQLAPNDPEVLLRLAYALEVQGSPQEALAQYREVLELAPSSAEVRARLALFHLKNGDPTRAVEHIQEALDLNPDARKYLIVLGDARLHQALQAPSSQRNSLLRQSEDAFQEVIEEVQGVLQAEALIGHGNALLALGREQEAIERYDTAIEIQGDRLTQAVAMTNKAHAFANLKDPIEALNLALNAVKLYPESAVAHYNVGCIYANRSNWQAARQSFETARQYDVNNAPAAYNLASALMEGRGEGQARQTFRENVERGHFAADSRINLAAMDVGEANWGDARESLLQALREEGGSVLAQANFALVLLREGKAREARQAAAEAIMAYKAMDDPAPAVQEAAALAHQVRGILYARDEAWQDARQEFESAVDLRPEEAVEAIVNLGHVLLEQSQYTRAQNLYERALLNQPNDPVVLNGLGHLYSQTGEYEKARNMLNRSLSQKRDQPRVAETLDRIESLLNSSWQQEEG